MMPQKPPPLSEIGRTAIQCIDDSYRWFGDLPLGNKNFDALRHHALALCGEAGEFANIVKKIDRASLDINDAMTRLNMSMELADVYTYLCNIAGILGIDLQNAYNVKRLENDVRFMEQRRERDANRERANSNGG